jgi:hypothetical protein
LPRMTRRDALRAALLPRWIACSESRRRPRPGTAVHRCAQGSWCTPAPASPDGNFGSAPARPRRDRHRAAGPTPAGPVRPLERTHQLGNAPGFLHEAHREVVLQQIAQASPDDDVIVSDQEAQRYHFPKIVPTGHPLNYLGPCSYSTTHRALSPPYVCIVLVFGRTNEPSL